MGKNQCAKKAKTVKTWKLKSQKNLCATMKMKNVKKNQKNLCATKMKNVKKNQITKMRSQCATKMKTAKKNQTWKAKSPIWKICQTSSVMMENGPSVKSNLSTWVRSNAKATNACFTVWKVSWLKATEKPNVKRTKTVNGNSTKNLVPVSNVV